MNKILVVEDCKFTSLKYKAMLSKTYPDAIYVTDGMKAMKAICDNDLDLVITDLDLGIPDITGVDIINFVKTMDHSIQCIVVTANNTVDNAVKCLKDDGAYDFIEKPIRRKTLLTIVKKSLEKRESIKKIRDGHEKLKQMALYDTLTGLARKDLLMDRLEQYIKESERLESPAVVAVMYMDLDGFKSINDTRGHDFGDKVLKTSAELLKNSLRKSDTVGRIGGDEFATVLSLNCDKLTYSLKNNQKVLTILCERIIKNISENLIVDGHHCDMGISIGVSFFPSDAKKGDLLLKLADLAMYNAKENGKNQMSFYSDVINDELSAKEET